MKDKRKDFVIQLLEKFRTDDSSSKPRVEENHPFVYSQNGVGRKRRWFRNLSILVVFIMIFSISVTVYANYDQIFGTAKKDTVNKQRQASTPKKVAKTEQVDNKEDSITGEALPMEFEEIIKEDIPKKKVATSNPRRQSSSRLVSPPQPKKQDKPARNATPIQLPDDYKKRIQNQSGQSDEVKKKK